MSGGSRGLGGFLLPSLLGTLKDKTGSFGIGFAVLTMLACTGFGVLLVLRKSWSRNWPKDAALRAGLVATSEELDESYAASV